MATKKKGKTLSSSKKSSNLPPPMGLYPSSRKVGNLLFVSGMGSRDGKTDMVPGLELDKHGNYISFDFEAQVHSVFNNVKIALEEAGSSWDKIVDVTVFLVNIKRDFKTYNRIYAEYFKKNMPCRTTVEVNALPSSIAIELKVIATVD